MPDTYTSQFSGEEIDSALRAAQMISGASTPAELRKKLEIRGDTIPVSATDPTPVSEALTASGGGVNPNLLDNWYFGRPVNQRGQTEYTEAGYYIDRWILNGDTATLNGDGITFVSPSAGRVVAQPIEFPDFLSGKTVTFSIYAKVTSGEWYLTDTENFASVHQDVPISTGITSWTFEVADANKFGSGVKSVGFWGGTKGGQITALAAKLELGDTQTLAHKENGVWVLNEIPDYGEQLRRCQRYYFVTNANHFFSGWCTTTEKFWTHIPTPVPMRAIPAISVIKPGSIIFGTSGANFATSANQYEIENADATGIKMAVNIAGLTLGAGILCDGQFAFSADL